MYDAEQAGAAAGTVSLVTLHLWAPSPEAVTLIWAMLFQLDVSKVRELAQGFRST